MQNLTKLPKWLEEHSQRVSNLAVELAGALGVSDEADLEAVRRGAYLHDLGKVEVDEKILNKPGPLTEEERRVMNRHTEASVRLSLEAEPELPQIAREMIAHHHDRGEQVPWAGKLMAVVDQWDALTNDRPYRKALNRAEAERIMREEKSGLDQEMVEVFLKEVVGS